MASTDIVSSISEEKESVKTEPNEDAPAEHGQHQTEDKEPPADQFQRIQIGDESTNQAGVIDASLPSQMLVKHPLQYRWVLWYCKQDRSKQWEECLKEVATFDTVEDFWALYNHIQLASGLSWGSDYYLFKEGIRPMWEDPNNIEGGRWLIQVDKARRNELLDHYWLELLMAVVGEQFDDCGENVCGVVVNIRQKGDKVSLWTRDSTKTDMNRKIGTIAKQKLGLTEQINYEEHRDTSHKNSSTVKARLRV